MVLSHLVSTSESENQMKGGLLLDVVVGESSSVLVLDLSLDILNAVGGFDLESDGLAGQSLDEDLHSSSESENQMKGGLLLDVVVGESSSVLQLLASEDQPLL